MGIKTVIAVGIQNHLTCDFSEIFLINLALLLKLTPSTVMRGRIAGLVAQRLQPCPSHKLFCVSTGPC